MASIYARMQCRPIEDLGNAVERLASTESSATRAKALSELEQFAAVDIVVSPAWDHFQHLFSLLLVGDDDVGTDLPPLPPVLSFLLMDYGGG